MAFGSYEDMMDFQRREQGDDSPAPLVFTASDMEGWTEEDHEAAGLAMERDMADREHYWQRRAETAEARLSELEGDDG